MSKRYLRLTCLAILFCTLLFSLPVSALRAQELQQPQPIEATIAPIQLRINEGDVDGQRALYPLLFYNNITYIPLTYNLCQALGLESSYDPANGLSVRPDPYIPLKELKQDLLPEDQPSQTANDPAPSITVTGTVYLAGKLIDNAQQEYPLLLFREITYLPLTWNFVHDMLQISYTFQEEGAAKVLSLIRPLPFKSVTDEQLPQIVLAARSRMTSDPLTATAVVYRGDQAISKTVDRFSPRTKLVWHSSYDLSQKTEEHLLSISPSQYVTQSSYKAPSVGDQAYSPSSAGASAYGQITGNSVSGQSYSDSETEDSIGTAVYRSQPITNPVNTGWTVTLSSSANPSVDDEEEIIAISDDDDDADDKTATAEKDKTEEKNVSSSDKKDSDASSVDSSTYKPASASESSYKPVDQDPKDSTSKPSDSSGSSSKPSTTSPTTVNNKVYRSADGKSWQLLSSGEKIDLPQPPQVPVFDLVTPVEGWQLRCENGKWFIELDHMTLKTDGMNEMDAKGEKMESDTAIISLFRYRIDMGTWTVCQIVQEDYAYRDGHIAATQPTQRIITEISFADIEDVPLP